MRIKLLIIIVVLLAVAVGSYFFGRALWAPLHVKVDSDLIVAEVGRKFTHITSVEPDSYVGKAGYSLFEVH